MTVDTATHYTMAEYLALPDDGKFYELVRGTLRVTPAPFGPHGRVVNALADMLKPFVQARRLGEVFASDLSVVTERDPDSVRAPDVSFFKAGRLPRVMPLDYGALPAPDLAVEVLSPGNSRAEMAEKVDEYVRAGVRLVWVLDPRARTVTVTRDGGESETLAEGDTLDGADVFSGFSCPVAALFAGVGPNQQL